MTDFANNWNSADCDRQQKKKKIAKYVILGIAVIFFIVYNLPFAKDLRAYDDAEDKNTSEAYMHYISEYPDGIKIEDAWGNYITCEDSSMASMADYLRAMPNGEMSGAISAKYDARWDDEISRYKNSRFRSSADSSAVIYMETMMNYMKTHRVNTIVVGINSTIKLKNFEDYGDLQRYYATLDMAGWDESKMVSITDNFTSADDATLQSILSEGIQRSFDYMFPLDFIKLVGLNSLTNGADSVKIEEIGYPYVTINYTICNEEYIFGIPQIWTYGTQYIVENYLLGIDILFGAEFRIPDSDVVYYYVGTGHPEETISEVMNIRDGYRKMTTISFAKFSNEMSKNLGLKSIYFQGE